MWRIPDEDSSMPAFTITFFLKWHIPNGTHSNTCWITCYSNVRGSLKSESSFCSLKTMCVTMLENLLVEIAKPCLIIVDYNLSKPYVSSFGILGDPKKKPYQYLSYYAVFAQRLGSICFFLKGTKANSSGVLFVDEHLERSSALTWWLRSVMKFRKWRMNRVLCLDFLHLHFKQQFWFRKGVHSSLSLS